MKDIVKGLASLSNADEFRTDFINEMFRIIQLSMTKYLLIKCLLNGPVKYFITDL